ncbi:gamma-glutamyl-gamma-aminobutyrate hydrolase family protein [Wukongibacter sp. M2B1]|uniref:gamma-glutamyl-gamma-aminobutyrate hydrolase family protein n=1 Tax=Wukongibacter sp. M2B1 TaxID=3088895 RepID=UPI003D79D4F6
MKPVIGITTFWEKKIKPDRLYNLVSHNYIKSVYLAGGIPILIPLVDDKEFSKEYLETIDGIIFSGGDDISPLSYGENPIRHVQTICQERDEFEIEFFLEALKLNMPILGVCRGMQLMNVGLGGNLYQDINSEIENSLGHFPQGTSPHNLYHQIKIDEESKLFDIFRKTEIKVNSFHHQAVKKRAKDLKETAWASDGIIEAIEHEDRDFVVGVQWHPEDLTIHHPVFLKLFRASREFSKKK